MRLYEECVIITRLRCEVQILRMDPRWMMCKVLEVVFHDPVYGDLLMYVPAVESWQELVSGKSSGG